MSYKFEHGKLSWGGTIYDGADIWTNSIHIGDLDAPVSFSPSQPAVVGYAELAAEKISDWFKGQSTGISQYAQLEWVKLATIGTDGKYTTDPVIIDLETPVKGYVTAPVAPQLSLALSMVSNIRRGPGKDGRIYPPLSGQPLTDGRDSSPDGKAYQFKLFLDSINSITADFAPGLMVVNVSPAGTGHVHAVTKVRVGNVIDTQRRRRNKFIESYAVQPLAGEPADF